MLLLLAEFYPMYSSLVKWYCLRNWFTQHVYLHWCMCDSTADNRFKQNIIQLGLLPVSYRSGQITDLSNNIVEFT